MSIESGKYFAIPVESNDAEFEVTVNNNPDLTVITAQRATQDDAPQTPTDEIEQLKGQVKEGIAGLKKGGLKGAFSFAKKLAADSMKDDKEKLAEKKQAEYKDPMDPVNAFAQDLACEVKYEPIYSLENKDKDTGLYQFRTASAYGVLMPLGDGLFREVSFAFPSHEYAEKSYPEQNVGHSVANWRREDDSLHRMRVHYLSQDQAQAQAAAAKANLTQEKADYLSVDLGSTRANEKTRFSAPRLEINAKSGELSLNFLYAWFLPRLTESGRQIQYNWDALRVRVLQGDKLIKRVVCWSNSKEMDYIKSQRTNMELMNGGYIGELTPGEYRLQVSIYEREVFDYPFEVIKTVSTDTRTEVETYYSLKTPVDNFAQLEYVDEAFQLNVDYTMRHLVETMGSVDKFTVSCKVMRDGKSWPDYEVSEFDGSNMQDEISVRNNLGWMESARLQIPFGSKAEYQGREAVPDGVYTIHVSVDDKEVDQIDFEIKAGKLTTEAVTFPDLALADFDFPEEHYHHLFPLKSAQ